MRHAVLLLRALRGDVLPYATAGVMAICLLLPLIIGGDAFSYRSIKKSLAETVLARQLGIFNENLTGGNLERAHAESARAERALSATSRAEFYRLATEYYEMSPLFERGMSIELNGKIFEAETQSEAKSAWCRAMAERPDGDFDSVEQMPALYHLPYAVAKIPVLIWILPAAVIALQLKDRTSGNRLMGNVPISPTRMFLARLAAGSTGVALILVMAFLPSFALALAKGGLGDPAFPIFAKHGGELVRTTALASWIWMVALIYLNNLFALAVALGVARSLALQQPESRWRRCASPCPAWVLASRKPRSLRRWRPFCRAPISRRPTSSPASDPSRTEF